MVSDALMGSIWTCGAFCLIWWISDSPIYHLEELVKLVLQVSEHIETF